VSTSRSGIATIPDICCPSAALLDEIGRCADATKRVYTDGVLAVIGDFAARLAPHDPQSAHAKVLSIYAVMIGALQLSPALADRQLAVEILGEGGEVVHGDSFRAPSEGLRRRTTRLRAQSAQG
jgi:hypothetical protein